MNMKRQHDSSYRRHERIGLELARELEKLGNVHRHRSQCGKLAGAEGEPRLKTFPQRCERGKDSKPCTRRSRATSPSLNVIVNNAGTMRTINLHNEGESLEELTREIEINLMGPIRMVRSFCRPEEEAARGDRQHLVGPSVRAAADCADLLVNQGALHSYTLSLRVQLKKHNVKVFEIGATRDRDRASSAALRSRRI